MGYGNNTTKTMSETKKEEVKAKIVETSTLTDVDWVNADKKLKAIYTYYVEFAGKKDHNPYFFLEKNWKPLKERLDSGEKTQDLFDAIKTLEEKPENAIAPKILPDTRDYSKYYKEFAKRQG